MQTFGMSQFKRLCYEADRLPVLNTAILAGCVAFLLSRPANRRLDMNELCPFTAGEWGIRLGDHFKEDCSGSN